MNSGPDRKLTVILCADVCGYSRLMNRDEGKTLDRLKSTRGIFRKHFGDYGGRIINMTGDGLFGEFSSAVKAVQCAIAIQEQINAEEAEKPKDEQMLYRIGINIGDVIIEGDDLFGGGVNVASRLEALAPVGGLNISGAVYEQVRSSLPERFSYQGERKVKNIAEPVSVFSLAPEGTATGEDNAPSGETYRRLSEEEEARLRAYVRRQAGFYRRAMIFGVLILFLFIINLTSSRDSWWFFWPAIPLSMILLIDAVRIFGKGDRMEDWQSRQFEKLKNRREGGDKP
ncbi:MAG: adenylate/guanylate cyclase domain-containing protein [Alphaproteobacteria bacterium]|nr:MAG: adenylate/guanylate cyclase domain-containing protein [Alphaproteobacteria bacterium]